MTLGADGTRSLLHASDFHNNRVDVFDKNRSRKGGSPRVLDFSGTEYADCMTEVLRANDINAGFDMGPTGRSSCGLYPYALQTDIHSSMTALNCR